MAKHSDLDDPKTREVIVVGGGIAGLSAAIYLGRAQRDALVIDSGRSMAKWEPVVENYLGFPTGVGGEELCGADAGKRNGMPCVSCRMRSRPSPRKRQGLS